MYVKQRQEGVYKQTRRKYKKKTVDLQGQQMYAETRKANKLQTICF